MRKSHALWGVLLIIIGVLWILSTTNAVSIDIIGAIRALWPVFIVAAGITLLLNKEAHALRAIVWVLVIVLIAGYGIYLSLNDSPAEGSHVFELKSGMETAKMDVNAGAVSLRIGSADSALAQVNTNIRGLSYNFSGGKSNSIRYAQKWKPLSMGSGKNFHADLNGTVTWDLEFNTGATDGILDFSGFPLKSCNINTGACDLRIIAGSLQDEATIKCNGGAVSISLSIPEGTGIRIESNAAVNDISGNGINIEKNGKNYESSNFDSTEKVVILRVNSGASDITVNVL